MELKLENKRLKIRLKLKETGKKKKGNGHERRALSNQMKWKEIKKDEERIIWVPWNSWASVFITWNIAELHE